MPKYSADTTIFICPGSKDASLPSGVSFEQQNISYAYYMGRQLTGAPAALMSDRQVDTSAQAAGQPLFSATGQPPRRQPQQVRRQRALHRRPRRNPAPPAAALVLPLGDGVALLNPKP